MKKFLTLVLAGAMILTLAACDKKDEQNPAPDASAEPTATAEASAAPSMAELSAKSEGVMTYDEYLAAAVDAPVVIETYVQDAQSWWDNKATVYTQDPDGAYFLYELTCSEEDYAKLVPGTKIRVEGFRAEWAGEVEVASGATFTFVEGAPTYVAEPVDVTAFIGTDELEKYMNQKVVMKNAIIESVSYKGGEAGDDIYVDVNYGGEYYSLCLEYYLNGSDEAFYNKVASLKEGDIVDIEGFLYWYYGMNTHITAVTVTGSVNDKSEGVMSYAEYVAAAVDEPVVIETYVQAAQSWWDNKATVYTQDAEGGYFLYEMACSEEDYAKLVPGTKIRVNGFRAEWAGEIEVASGCTFEFVDGPSYIAVPRDVTYLLDKDELANHMNKIVYFTNMTVKSVEYKGGQPGDDIYVTMTAENGNDYDFCLEYYLNGNDEKLYNKVGNLEAGTVANVKCFLYWYNGMNPHITAVELQ